MSGGNMSRTDEDASVDRSVRRRRATEEVRTVWERARERAGGAVPGLGDLPLDDGAMASGRQFLLRCDHDAGNPVVIVAGGSLARQLGPSPVGASLYDSAPARMGERLLEACRSALRSLSPVDEDGSFTGSDGVRRHFRFCMLPVASAADDVSYLYGALGISAPAVAH